jgi:hypothetical protein
MPLMVGASSAQQFSHACAVVLKVHQKVSITWAGHTVTRPEADTLPRKWYMK